VRLRVVEDEPTAQAERSAAARRTPATARTAGPSRGSPLFIGIAPPREKISHEVDSRHAALASVSTLAECLLELLPLRE
jgi:hypothetical protein